MRSMPPYTPKVRTITPGRPLAWLGMAWNVGGWLLFPFLKQLAPERLAQLKQRVADELTTTFASRYAREITLAQALTPEAIGEYARMSTGRKTLLRLAAR